MRAGVNETAEDSAPPPPTICIELKPKAGFLPTAATIARANRAKKAVSRFAMHQHLKLSMGEVGLLRLFSLFLNPRKP
eukprot:jgi/Mesen1/4012/ME000211S03195